MSSPLDRNHRLIRLATMTPTSPTIMKLPIADRLRLVE